MYKAGKFNFFENNIRDTLLLGGEDVTIGDLAAVSNEHAKVEFSPAYARRVRISHERLCGILAGGQPVYGVNTGLGANYNKALNGTELEQYQKNILMSHACSVGEPLPAAQVRAIMLMILLNLGQGYSGVRLEVLDFIKELLNKRIAPYVPGHGSVGYLCVEAHIALLFYGMGKAYFDGKLYTAGEALTRAGLAAPRLQCKEGLALISSTTSVTALAALALYDMVKSALTLDIAAAMSLEAMKGTLRAFDSRLVSLRRHREQQTTAANIVRLLRESGIEEKYHDHNLQDALSLRCIPQLHGAAKKVFSDACNTITAEMNSCCDNPVIVPEGNGAAALMGCNSDGAYVGMQADAMCIAACNLAKISERRVARILDDTLSGLPAFLVENGGLNNGFMIAQYSAAGILGEMRILASPATTDNVTTSANQEDYVSMAYNASLKAMKTAGFLEYIAAVELITAAQGLELNLPLPCAPATGRVLAEIRKYVPKLENDMFLSPCIETVRKLVHGGIIIKAAEEITGPLEI